MAKQLRDAKGHFISQKAKVVKTTKTKKEVATVACDRCVNHPGLEPSDYTKYCKKCGGSAKIKA